MRSASTASATGVADVAPDHATVRKQAVAWYVRLCSGSVGAADQLAWQQWHAQHPEHQRAWQRIEAMRQALQQVPARIAVPALSANAEHKRRRQALRGIALLASGGTLGYLSYRGAERDGMVQSMLADYRTGVGLQRHVQLQDGARLTLNTDSAVDVRYDGTQRLLRLWRGEILVETARHRQAQRAQQAGAHVPATDTRPFVVETAQGRVVALGTRFTVRQFAGRTEVAVLADAVELHPRDAAGAPVLLTAGQQASFTRVGAAAAQPADDGAGAWESGSLLVNDRSLGAVVAELARYRHGHLGCDPTVAHLRISGAYPLADTDRALELLAQTFPLRLRSMSRFWVTLAPR